MTEFVVLRPKPYSYLVDNYDKKNKAKELKKCVIKRKLWFELCKRCLKTACPKNKINYLKGHRKDATILKRI